MLTHGAWFLSCDVVAVYRLAILCSKDKITDPFRNWLHGHGWRSTPVTGIPIEIDGLPAHTARWLYELVVCPFCNSIWLAAVVVALTRFVPGFWQYPAMLLALSGATCLLADRA